MSTTTTTIPAADLGVAVDLIDKTLGEIAHRELCSTDEISDLLLDLRLLISPVGHESN